MDRTNSVRLENSTYKKLKDAAKVSGRKIGWILTKAVQEYLERNKGK